MRRLLSAIGLVVGLLIVSSSPVLAADNYEDPDKQCTYFDKIIFTIKDSYGKENFYDIKVVQKSLKDLTDLTKAVTDFCSTYYNQYQGVCDKVKAGQFEIKNVDFAVACYKG